MRELRNLSIHPIENSYKGGVHRGKIILTINILKILFGDEQLLRELEKKRDVLRSELFGFNQKVLSCERGKDLILAQDLSFIDVFVDGEDQILLLGIDPVANLQGGTALENQWVKPLFVEIRNPQIATGWIRGHDLLSDTTVGIFINNHPVDVMRVETFRNTIHKANLPGRYPDFPEAKYNPQLTFTM